MTPKQERFVAEYLVDLNATQAAIRCGYSEKTAPQAASRLLRNVKVSEAVAESQKKRLAETGITAAGVLNEIRKLAFSDLRRAFVNGTLTNIDQMDDETGPAIAAVEVVKRNLNTGDGQMDEVHKVKLWDKPKNLEMLAKHLNLLIDKVQHSGDVNFTWQK